MRIRSIKPEFWRSDDIDALSLPDRLLFIGLWSYVDDSGVGLDKEAAVAADLFAGDLSREPRETSVRVHGGLQRLTEASLITRYTVKGRRYLHITNWDRHQKINRPTESRYPGPTSENAQVQAAVSDGSVKAHADSPFGAVEQGSRGAGDKDAAGSAPAAEPQLELVPQERAETLNQTSQRLARVYYDRVPLSNFPALLSVAKKALNANYPADQIEAALVRLAAEGRSVTTNTLRHELDGMPAPQWAKPRTGDDRTAAWQSLKTGTDDNIRALPQRGDQS